jgi:hypothetical protein
MRSLMIVRVIKLKRMRLAGHIARVGRVGDLQGFGGGPKTKRSPGIPRLRLEDNIKTVLQEMGWGHGLD